MALEDTLRGIREASAKRIPADKAAIMHGATERLRASGIMDRVIRPEIPCRASRCQTPMGASALGGFPCQGASGSDFLPRQLVTLLQRRAVCFAASEG